MRTDPAKFESFVCLVQAYVFCPMIAIHLVQNIPECVLSISALGVHIMACVPEETQSPELLALEKNSSKLCQGITSISTVTDFALLLVEKSFITSSASSSILHTMGVSEQQKCGRFLDAVREQVRTDPAKFKSFVGILRQEPALTFYANILINTRGEKCVCT